MGKIADPDLPRGAIVESHPDVSDVPKGHKIRNDGVVLTPASKNPWYVLATVAGEQTDEWRVNYELHEQNRRFWNGWMCQTLSEERRAEVAEKLRLPVAELAPLNGAEKATLDVRFANAFPEVAAEDRLPDPSKVIDMGKLHLATSFAIGRCYFPGAAVFEAAHFAGSAFFETALFSEDAIFETVHFAWYAVFNTAHFAEYAYFEIAHFSEYADFETAHFAGNASFQTAHFAGTAYFETAHFAGLADFQTAHFAESADFETAHFAGTASFHTAHFAGRAYFETAQFYRLADFSDGAFKGKTIFAGATFHTEVPAFFHREMHQNTSFTDDPKLWPKVTPDNATEGKRRYTRLRQVAAEIYDPDLEHFFLRQEMRCKEEIERGRSKWFNVKIFQAFRFFADSGISVGLPVAWLAYIWLFGAFCFAGYFDSGAPEVMATDIQDNRYWTAAGVSFGNLFGFLGINRLYFTEVLQSAPERVQFVAGAQTVLGVILLFFFGLGLRNRFRLK